MKRNGQTRILAALLAIQLATGLSAAVLLAVDPAHAESGSGSDGDGGDSSGSGSEGDDGGHSGSGSGESDDGGSDNSGGDDHDDDGEGGRGRSGEGRSGRDPVSRFMEVLGSFGSVAHSRSNGSSIELQYSDGWREVISEGRYGLFDNRGRQVVGRPASRLDYDRMEAARR